MIRTKVVVMMRDADPPFLCLCVHYGNGVQTRMCRL